MCCTSAGHAYRQRLAVTWSFRVVGDFALHSPATTTLQLMASLAPGGVIHRDAMRATVRCDATWSAVNQMPTSLPRSECSVQHLLSHNRLVRNFAAYHFSLLQAVVTSWQRNLARFVSPNVLRSFAGQALPPARHAYALLSCIIFPSTCPEVRLPANPRELGAR